MPSARSDSSSYPGSSQIKNFRCNWTGCAKSFSRAEHLQRHALNHDEIKGSNTCARCSAVFKRKDLLDRHIARHKERDDEAGGDGLGILQTRKRLWRDSTGAVVAERRPEHEKSKHQTRSGTKKASTIRAASQAHQPLSPSGSSEDQIAIGRDFPQSPENTLLTASNDDIWQLSMDEDVVPIQLVDSFDFLCNASWGSQSQENSGSDMFHNDMFAPDTASSFNMPFVTTSYYDWLFADELSATRSSNREDTMAEFDGFPATPPHPPLFRPSKLSGHTRLFPEDSAHRSSDLAMSSSVPRQTNITCLEESSSDESMAAHQILAMAQSPASNLLPNFNDNFRTFGSGVSFESFPAALNTRHLVTPENSRSTRSSSDTTSINRLSKIPRNTPVLNETARDGILNLIDRARPKHLSGSIITRDHPQLSIGTLQLFCDLYFSRFNVSYPLLHQATFECDRVDPLLLTAVLLLGATYSDKDSHLFAICIHDTMRTQILGSKDFNTRPSLWILQTILLVECFGKSRAGQLQHDMSHLFHGLLINLIRRSDCQSAKCKSFEGKDMGADTRWRAEVDAEQRRRLALLCFMWDTQHAVLFSQSLCMNAAELKLPLPWNETLWEADTAEEWQAVNSTERPAPMFLSVLKAYINPRTRVHFPSLDTLSRVLMLHGLMSVAWDLNRRSQTSLGVTIVGNEEPWQARLARSYDAWKEDFDSFGKEILHSVEHQQSEKDEFQKICAANTAIYYAAKIILYVEIIDLQIFAGASHIIGRPVTELDRDRSRKRIEKWVKTDTTSASRATSHAAHLLRDGIRKLKNWDAGDVFHYAWCLYLATLTCWAFQTCAKVGMTLDNEEATDDLDSENDDVSDWDAEAEMNAFVSAVARSSSEGLAKIARKYRTTDLPKVMAKHLGTVRWAIVHEGMIVLKGLGRPCKPR